MKFNKVKTRLVASSLNKNNFILVPVDGGNPVPVSIPKNMYCAPNCDLEFIKACEKAGLKTTDRGTIAVDEIDTEINYTTFIKDCNDRCFKCEYERLYQRLDEYGYDFFSK